MNHKRTNAKNTGKQLEKLLDSIHADYRLRGIADLEKVDPPVRVLGGGFKRRVIFKENPFLDYMGAITESGQLLMIEAKSTADATLPCGGKNGVTAKQIASRKRWQDAGALTAVVWYCISKQAARLVTIEDIDITLDHRKSVTWETAIEIENDFDYLAQLIKIKQPTKSDEIGA